MKAYARPIILVLSAVALAASLYSLYYHYQLVRNPAFIGVCDISSTVSCGAVFQSSYAYVSGVPVAALGAIWATAVLLLAAMGMGQPNRERAEAAAGYVFLLSVVGLAATFYWGYASFFVLQRYCVVCISVYVASIGIFLVASNASTLSVPALAGRLAGDIRWMFSRQAAAAAATVWLVGSAALIAFFPREAPLAAVPTGGAVASAPAEAPPPATVAGWHAWLDRQPRVADVAPTGDVKVRLVKFNDYQCPACRMTWVALTDVIRKYEAQYPGAFVYDSVDFPLEAECGPVFNHYGACEAAVAVRLAKEQGRGFEMETWLFGRQAELSRDVVARGVQEVAGVTDFDARYDAVLEEVRKDVQLGNKLGVTGTPTFYLNGIHLEGMPNAAFIDAAIAHELRKAGVEVAS